MQDASTYLLSISSTSIGGAAFGFDALDSWGSIGRELVELLQIKNGFCAYESALILRPLNNSLSIRGIMEWNAHALWHAEYRMLSIPMLCFAEDIFGVQFCIADNHVGTFDPETGELKTQWSSLDDWGHAILADENVMTGHSIAHEWQQLNGPLPLGSRLIPKIPFVLGGEYKIDNLFLMEDVQAMHARASIANQIYELPDGTQIRLQVDE